MSIVVTGATGHYGGLVVKHLIERGTPAADIVAVGRNEQRLAQLASEYGVRTAPIDYDKPETLGKAFTGADSVLLVSGSTLGTRVQQHKNVVDTARESGVNLLAYTSVLDAEHSPLAVAPDHRATEEYIKKSGVPYVFLRNAWYTENYATDVEQAGKTGVIESAAGDGVIASATRDDLADAAAVVLSNPDEYRNTTLELSGGRTFTYADLAAVASAITGREVVYKNVTTDQLTEDLSAAGLPKDAVSWVVKLAADTASGALSAKHSDKLANIVGHKLTGLEDGLRAAVK